MLKTGRTLMSWWRLYYHLVWATKKREPLIGPEIEDRLYAYLVRKAAESDVLVYAINGWYDHVHLVAAIPPKHAVSQVAKRLKGASSHYLNHEGSLDYHFAWQRSFGVLTLGERQRPRAEAYVRKQKQHHDEQTANAWFECCAESDEGPIDTGILVEQVPLRLREEQSRYGAWGEPPF
jgi:REP element-mobilizing transposase RayT